MFKKKQLLVFYTILLAVVFSVGVAVGCKSKFERLRASNDIAAKYQEAVRLYNKQDYSRALILFSELAQRYRGYAEAEDMHYFHAYTNFKLKDYITSRYEFKRFAETYPSSARAEECRFMAAKCYYLESPTYSLDQNNTVKAIDALQLFINLYPKSERVAEAKKLIDDLHFKLETKSYANAKLFLDIGSYKSAIIAFKNAVRDHPDTRYAEEIDFLTIKAQYLFAKHSFENKQESRFNEVIQLAVGFTNKYASSQYLKEIEKLKKDADEGIVRAQNLVALEDIKESQGEQHHKQNLN